MLVEEETDHGCLNTAVICQDYRLLSIVDLLTNNSRELYKTRKT